MKCDCFSKYFGYFFQHLTKNLWYFFHFFIFLFLNHTFNPHSHLSSPRTKWTCFLCCLTLLGFLECGTGDLCSIKSANSIFSEVVKSLRSKLSRWVVINSLLGSKPTSSTPSLLTSKTSIAETTQNSSPKKASWSMNSEFNAIICKKWVQSPKISSLISWKKALSTILSSSKPSWKDTTLTLLITPSTLLITSESEKEITIIDISLSQTHTRTTYNSIHLFVLFAHRNISIQTIKYINHFMVFPRACSNILKLTNNKFPASFLHFMIFTIAPL